MVNIKSIGGGDIFVGRNEMECLNSKALFPSKTERLNVKLVT